VCSVPPIVFLSKNAVTADASQSKQFRSHSLAAFQLSPFHTAVSTWLLPGRKDASRLLDVFPKTLRSFRL